jgi:dipeptidyl aminopeptidase/acylaminoacyl peptidase
MSFVLSLVAAAALQAATPATPSVHGYNALTLAPGGKRLAAIESAEAVGAVSDNRAAVVIRSAKGEITNRFDPCETCRYSGPAWSADGQKLAFIGSDMKAGTATLFVVEGDKTRVVTTVTGVASTARWAPDGQSIAMLATVGARKQTGATQAGVRQVGEIGVAGAIDEQRIAVAPAAGGDLKFASPDDTFVYEYDWTPDSKGFVGTAAKGDGDNNWWVASLQAFGVDGSSRVIAAPKMQLNAPRVSPDGKSVAFIGGLMSDFGAVGGDVWTVPFTGGQPTNLTEGYKGTFTSLDWTAKGPMASAILGGDSAIARIDPAGGAKVTIMARGEVSYSAGDGRVSFDPSGKLAATVVDSFAKAPQVLLGAPEALKPITHDNDALTATYIGKSVTWKNEGFDVQGWLQAPIKEEGANVEPGKTYPMVVIVHGGPSSAVTSRYGSSGTVYDLLKAGYYVFQPNPRGSFGQGEAFKTSNRRDFGGGDLRDILAGVDAVEKIAPVDDKRLGVFGHSYGGYMTMWTVTHSQRFKAAVAGAGIANWISYYGQNGIDQWMVPFFGDTAYNDPAIYDQLSPIRTVKDAKTPTFIYVGERDVETPAAQSMEFWHGLKAMGVETSLVIYQDEGHGIRQAKNRADLTNRIVGWFNAHLGS